MTSRVYNDVFCARVRGPDAARFDTRNRAWLCKPRDLPDQARKNRTPVPLCAQAGRAMRPSWAWVRNLTVRNLGMDGVRSAFAVRCISEGLIETEYHCTVSSPCGPAGPNT